MSITEDVTGAYETLSETEEGWPDWEDLGEKERQRLTNACQQARRNDRQADLIGVLYAARTLPEGET